LPALAASQKAGGQECLPHTGFGMAEAIRRDLVVASQGLRGSDFGVVWRREMSLPHWKPGGR